MGPGPSGIVRGLPADIALGGDPALDFTCSRRTLLTLPAGARAPGVMPFHCRDHSFSRRFVGKALSLMRRWLTCAFCWVRSLGSCSLVVFIADSLATSESETGAAPRQIVNWDVAADRLNDFTEAIRVGWNKLTR